MQSPLSNKSPQGFQTQSTGVGEFNAMAFMIQNLLNKMNIATLVKIVSCTNDGGLSPVGFVDVQPLVNQLDGQNNAIPHGVVYGLVYCRFQGGANAVIMDPEPGDIGIAVFSDRDISSVKVNKAQANPGTKRRNNMSDGMYIGGCLNGTPTQFVQFNGSGITMKSPTQVAVVAPDIVLDGNVAITGNVATAGNNVTAGMVTGMVGGVFAGIDSATHVHSGVDPGSGSSGPPV